MNIHTIRNAMVKRAAGSSGKPLNISTHGILGKLRSDFGLPQKDWSITPQWADNVGMTSGLLGSLQGMAASEAGITGAAALGYPLILPAVAVGAGAAGRAAILGHADSKLNAAQQAAAKPVSRGMQTTANRLRMQRGQQPVRYPERWENGKPVYKQPASSDQTNFFGTGATGRW